MIEPRIGLQRFPSCSDVAISASTLKRGIFKRSPMRIFVAVVATAVSDLAKLRDLLAARGLMAARAGHGAMFTRQGVG